MAQIFDVRAAGGELVILGDSLVVPSSGSTSSVVPAGAIRRNPLNGNLEYYAATSWERIPTAPANGDFIRTSGGTMTGPLVVNAPVRFFQDLRVDGFIEGTTRSAQYAADIAERYHSDASYEPGTVLAVGGRYEVTISTSACDQRLAGVVSTMPAYGMNLAAGNDSTHPLIALKGRVPVKVVGRIVKGDLLTTSDFPGHAMRAPWGCHAGAIIGIALADHDGLAGVVEVKV